MTDEEILSILQGQGATTSGAGGDPSTSATTGGYPDNPMEFFLRQTPGYQFAFNEGLRGIENSAAARGTLLTGGTLKALTRFGTGLADQTYGNAVNRYLSLADLGQRTAVAPF